MRPQTTRCLAVVLALSLLPLSVQAQTAPASASLAESLTGPAKAEYDAARRLYKLGDYGGAIVKFRHAYELTHEVRLLWNMALCERDMRHYAKVIRLLEQFRKEGDKRLSASEHFEASRIIADARPLVTNLRLKVNEAGANVFVDDEPAGTTPLAEPVLVDLGRRTVKVTKPGFQDYVEVHDVSGGSELAISVVLAPQVHEGRLKISAAKDSTISVDGATVGKAQWEGVLASGAHAVGVQAPGMRPYAVDLTIHDGESRTLAVTLEPESREGRLAISTDAGATIALDGKTQALGHWEGKVSTGVHAIRVFQSGMKTYNSEVIVHPGEARTVSVSLQRDSALPTVLWVTSSVVAAAGLAVGGYFLFKPSDNPSRPTEGSLAPGAIQLPP